VKTTKQLLEVWPEAVDYLPEEKKELPAQLPAVPVERLNCLIANAKGEKRDCASV
jgi:hypothetical protein